MKDYEFTYELLPEDHGNYDLSFKLIAIIVLKCNKCNKGK